MYKCIFSAHCIENVCDMSCPIFAESSYLLERNDIDIKNGVFQLGEEYFDAATRILDRFKDKVGTVIATSSDFDTVKVAELLTYCGICRHWKGSNLHTTVYNLKYSQYLDELKKSWTSKDSTTVDYMKIWSENAKVLVISSFDYVNFKEFEAQTLLMLLQSRGYKQLTTILVSPPVMHLLSNNGTFFNLLTSRYLKSDNVVRFENIKGGGSVK